MTQRPRTGQRDDPMKRLDRHQLYERSVQCPEADVRFFRQAYRKWNADLPRSLREDFCGTAAISAAWVRAHPEHSAIGIDLHAPTLAWGEQHNIRPLGKAAGRVRLIRADVRSVRRPKVDLIAALNFSYFVFKTREDLRSYFRAVRASLAPRGLFVLDIFGGWESQAMTVEKKRLNGFTYFWQNASFDPITHDAVFHIHFRFRDGTERRRAFAYHWRLWSIPEVLETLREAGFARHQVYWEGTDHKTGGGNGVFRVAQSARNTPGWVAYIVAGAGT
jgi:SAM-dependent methyltransferase